MLKYSDDYLRSKNSLFSVTKNSQALNLFIGSS